MHKHMPIPHIHYNVGLNTKGEVNKCPMMADIQSDLLVRV